MRCDAQLEPKWHLFSTASETKFHVFLRHLDKAIKSCFEDLYGVVGQDLILTRILVTDLALVKVSYCPAHFNAIKL